MSPAGWRDFHCLVIAIPDARPTSRNFLKPQMFRRGWNGSTSTWRRSLKYSSLRNKIQSEVQDSVQSSQRDYYLREQLKAIQKELGDVDDTQKDIAELKEKIETRRNVRRR